MIPITMRCSCVNTLFFPPPALPIGRRVWRTFRRHDFTYDGWNPIHETVTETAGAATNVTERQYFWGPDLSGSLQGAGGVGGLLAVSVGGRFHFPCYDANGNVTKYLDESGNAVAAYTYGDFGETLERSGPMADVFPHRFSTKYLDAETGLYYYGYRFYSPALKRWMSRDPIGETGGINLFALCENKYDSYDVLGLTEPSSFLNGIKDPETAKQLIEQHFSDARRKIDEFRRWCKQNGFRRSSILKTTRFSKKKVLSGIVKGAKRCTGLLLFVQIIFSPLEAGAEPLIINGQLVEDMIKEQAAIQDVNQEESTEFINFEEDWRDISKPLHSDKLETIWEWL